MDVRRHGVTVFAAAALALFLLVPPARADFASGKRAYGAGDTAAAYRQWLPLAETGDAAAQYRIGRMFRDGVGGRKNGAKAVFWFRKAAKQAHVRALLALGYMYDVGATLPKDAERAECLYLHAARRGYTSAQWNLYLLYREQHRWNSLDWLDRAAAQGHYGALHRKGFIWLKNPIRFDKTAAYMYLLLAEARGSKLATEDLGEARASKDPAVVRQLRAARSLAQLWEARKEAPESDVPPVGDACLPPPTPPG